MYLWSLFGVCEFQDSGYSGRYGITGLKLWRGEKVWTGYGKKKWIHRADIPWYDTEVVVACGVDRYIEQSGTFE